MIFWFEYDSGWQRMRPFEMRISYSLYIEALRPVQHFSHEHVALFGMEWWQFLYVLHIYQRTKICRYEHLGRYVLYSLSIWVQHPKTSRSLEALAASHVAAWIKGSAAVVVAVRCPLYHAWPAHSLLFPRVAPLLLSCVPGDIVPLKGAWVNGKHHCRSLLNHKENHLEMDIMIFFIWYLSIARLDLSECVRAIGAPQCVTIHSRWDNEDLSGLDLCFGAQLTRHKMLVITCLWKHALS